MGFFKTLGRIGLAAVTGGNSEILRAYSKYEKGKQPKMEFKETPTVPVKVKLSSGATVTIRQPVQGQWAMTPGKVDPLAELLIGGVKGFAGYLMGGPLGAAAGAGSQLVGGAQQYPQPIGPPPGPVQGPPTAGGIYPDYY